MRLRRLIGSLLATTLVATPLAIAVAAAPASAATPVTTRVVMEVSKKAATYKDRISVSGQVQGQLSDGSWAQLPYDTGGVTLQFLAAGTSTWRTLQSDSSGDSFYFYPVGVSGKGTYRVAYAGGTYDDYQFGTSEARSAINVQRKISYAGFSGRKAGIKGKVAPAGKTKIVIQKKQGRKYKKFKSVRTKATGRFTVVLPAPRRGKFHWKIIFVSNRQFASTTLRGTTSRSLYRASR